MAKIKLKVQSNYSFQYHTTLKVRDINYGGHLGNDAVVSLLQEARMALLRELGGSELDLGDGETGIIMNELAVNYRAEGRLMDEITIHSEINDLKTASFRICHRMARGDDTLVLAEVGLVAFNYKTGRISEVPGVFADQVSDLIRR
jgi:acyl-CoA thioester hydrolase